MTSTARSRHAVGEFLDGDRLGDRDFAHDLLGRHLEALRLLLLALGAAAEGGDASARARRLHRARWRR